MKMTWDTGTHRLVTKARLLLAAPDVVYQALEDYGQHVRQRKRMGDYDEDLEIALAGRDNRLIDLAHARNAGSNKLVATLYKRSLTGTGDIEYDKVIRLACLANQGVSNFMLSSDIAVVGQDEFRRLVREGDFEETTALMRTRASDASWLPRSNPGTQSSRIFPMNAGTSLFSVPSTIPA